MLNNDKTRHPSVQILANGTPLIGAIDAEVVSNNHYAADRFRARLSLDADLGAIAFWSTAGEILLDIRFGLDGAAISAIQGAVDRVEIDPIQRVLRLEGRDLTARLIEARTQESFVNRTASEIVEILAARRELTPEATATKTPVGRYYQNEHDHVILSQFSRTMTEWDLLTWLARQEGFDVYVQGTTLHFGPSRPTGTPRTIGPGDALSLRLERALTLVRDIEVVVKSWNTRQQDAFTQTARAAGTRRGGSKTTNPQRHVLVRPNLTQEQALQLAQTTLVELTRHRMVMYLTMPGDLTLAPRDALRLGGTGTAFDQIYYVDEITRRLSVQHGFVQHVRAGNDAVPSA